MKKNIDAFDQDAGLELTWAKDARHAEIVKKFVVLWGNHSTNDDDDVLTAHGLELLDELWHERLVSRGLRAHADHVYISIDRHLSNFCWCLQGRA